MHAPVRLRGGQPPGWQRLVLLAVLLGAFALRLLELTRQDIWWDEARNIDVALRPLLQIAAAPELDIQPPLYYWLLHGWSAALGLAVGQPAVHLAFGARVLSVLASVVGVALLFPLGRRAGGTVAGLLAVIVGAFAAFWLAESQETRMYTVGFAMLAAAALALLSNLHGPAGASSLWRRLLSPASLAFILLSAAALLTHYNAVFILAAWYLWWAARTLLQPGRWRGLLLVCLTGLITAVLLLPLAPIALRQIPDYANPNLIVPSVALVPKPKKYSRLSLAK